MAEAGHDAGIFTGLLLLVLGAGSWLSLTKQKPEAAVIRQNVALTHQLDSLRTIKSLEEQARDVALRYIECVNRHDIACLSDLMADTLERYHQLKTCRAANGKNWNGTISGGMPAKKLQKSMKPPWSKPIPFSRPW